MDVDPDGRWLSLSLGCGLPVASSQRRREPSEAMEPTLTLHFSDDPFAATTLKPKARLMSSLHSSTVLSSSTIKREETAVVVERVSSRTNNNDDEEEEEEEDGNAAKKKLRLTKQQSSLLEDRFKEHSTLNPKQKQALAKQLNLRPRQVEVWFQNRRARTKLKQTEVDCEFLRRCCKSLTEQNRRLHKEMNELRALKFASPLYMQVPAATAATLTMCPSCERQRHITAALVDGSAPKPAPAAGPFVGVPPKPHFFNPFTHSAAC